MRGIAPESTVNSNARTPIPQLHAVEVLLVHGESNTWLSNKGPSSPYLWAFGTHQRVPEGSIIGSAFKGHYRVLY